MLTKCHRAIKHVSSIGDHSGSFDVQEEATNTHLFPSPYSRTHYIPGNGRRCVGAANDVLNGADSGQSLPTAFD